MNSGFRVSIPNNVRKTIQNIKEIAGNHSDDEIYAMLRECSMDPNETAQKLLFQDTFHEVKRKRDRRKENVNNKELAESRRRPGMQIRGGRGPRGNYSSRYMSHDAGGGRNPNAGKENGVIQGTDKGVAASTSSPVSWDTQNKGTMSASRSEAGIANGPINVTHINSTDGHAFQVPGGSGILPHEESPKYGVDKIESSLPAHPDVKNSPAPVIGVEHGQSTPSSDHFLSSMILASVSGVYSSASDPVLVPSLDSRFPGVVGAIKREVGSQRTAVDPSITVCAVSKPISHDSANHLQINKPVSHDVADPELSSSTSEMADSEVRNPLIHGTMPSKPQGVERNRLPEASQSISSSTQSGSTVSRPSSTYSSRSQLIGPQKAAGPGKEWKPKATNPDPVHASRTSVKSNLKPTKVEASARSLPASSSANSEETTSNLQKKLEELHFSNGHVIIPNHLQVPESERSGLSFGSFDASFGFNTTFVKGPDSDKSSTPLSESSQGIEEAAEEPSSSSHDASPVAEEAYLDHPQSPTHMPENLSSSEVDVSSNTSAVPEYNQSKQEKVLPSGSPQHSVVHTAPKYSSFGLMPPVVGGQSASLESSDTQTRDISRLPSFVVQQPFDPSTSYYTHFYRPGADGDGRFSPFVAPGAATKYNGNIPVLSSQTAQSPQESGNSLVLSTAGPTPLVTQAAGAIQSPITVTQQPVPVFRQPTGVHISHYPPNYLPYSQYFSPFYGPPPTIHHFLSNTNFPQQPPTSGIYPPPAAASTNAVKYSLSQYKPITNTGNSTHIAMPAGYGPYSSTPTGYTPSPAVTSGNSTGNEDVVASQFKENNMYITGQQSEGSAVWFPALGRDISGLQASPFYNLPQGQHVAFAPTQASHGTFAGIYHPSQTVPGGSVHPLLQQSQTMAGAGEMAPPASVYQQPQRTQINWANNY